MNSSIFLTLGLLALMFGAGLSSASWGFKLGREALKGITQPDTRPTNNLAGPQSNSNRREGLVLLKEEKIVLNVKNTIINGGVVEKKTTVGESQKKQGKVESSQINQSQQTFPIISSDAGVVLEINDIRRWGNSLVLDVNLKNKGDRAVRFLYSFLNIKDEQGRVISASTEDLPGELPPNARRYYGIITIPVALLDNAKEISLELTDYPDQKLDLKISKIKID
ncbi:MAG: hypothetical protein O4861_22560 [Trichodesmium sp. St16_bin4-tuft]|nr:hypothetical protein [Trichodesmium sp. MAG_R01]MDE5068366.1 hypothetical protein [Trichodesmium sp. St4_bin8_1]MDE5073101.1 hypothetical protein [Trichodesmium sp. St5_bin8]MDE5077030.1 hypothetical protein [Trichodesmium sp. St2_bin6]MDE5091132.1 hypothetical protein [Trichodesmium sp. St18_bin3_1_1]MDE5100958.1 hypothetical protein [Trichodesmium sp. St16_bin4-tuft]MDE5103019.1 hypothetical protein [Trichodesmium sp. St19_bin2]